MPDRTPRSDSAETRRVLIATLRQMHEEGLSPTARELAKRSGRSHANVRYHLPDLEAAGLIMLREVPTTRVRREIVLLASAAEARP